MPQDRVKGEDRRSVFRLNQHRVEGGSGLGFPQLDMDRLGDLVPGGFVALGADEDNVIARLVRIVGQSFKRHIAGHLGPGAVLPDGFYRNRGAAFEAV
jgi:hypothetical protein